MPLRVQPVNPRLKAKEPWNQYAYPQQPRPDGYVTPYVIRPFIKSERVDQLQSIENKGMYKEELDIERGRFPQMHRTWLIHTDGSINDREFEFSVPPYIILFRDRLSLHKNRRQQLAKAGLLSAEKDLQVVKAYEAPASLKCNALEFPYCVPNKAPVRPVTKDLLESVVLEEDDK